MHLFSSQPRTLFDLLEVRALLEGESCGVPSHETLRPGATDPEVQAGLEL